MIGWFATAVISSVSSANVIIDPSGAVIVPDELMSKDFSLARYRPPSSKCSKPNPIGSNCLWQVAQLPTAGGFFYRSRVVLMPVITVDVSSGGTFGGGMR